MSVQEIDKYANYITCFIRIVHVFQCLLNENDCEKFQQLL